MNEVGRFFLALVFCAGFIFEVSRSERLSGLFLLRSSFFRKQYEFNTCPKVSNIQKTRIFTRIKKEASELNGA